MLNVFTGSSIFALNLFFTCQVSSKVVSTSKLLVVLVGCSRSILTPTKHYLKVAEFILTMEWSNEMVLRFLDIYENERMVWDPLHIHHKNRNEVNDAWRRIQAELGENISILDLKKKKESLMSSFRNCLYKVKHSMKSGDEYKPSWFAYNKIAGFCNLRDVSRSKMNEENVDSILGLDPDSETEDKSNNDEFLNVPSNPLHCIAEQISTPTLSLEPSAKKKKVTEDIMFDKMDKVYDILNIKDSLSIDKDECDLFGELTAKRLHEMEQNQRDYVMHEIENVMYKCDGKSATMFVLEYLQSKN